MECPPLANDMNNKDPFNHSAKDTGTREPTHDAVLRISDQNPATSDAKTKRSDVGIVDIARMAGVSTITVSRALRNPDIVSDKTLKKILEIVERTGYVSHPFARALRVGHSSIVIAFVSSMVSPQYSVAMQHCADVLEAHGYQLLTGLTSYSYPKEIASISTLRAIRPAAVLFTGVIELERNRKALRDLGIPILESWAYPKDPIDMLVGFSNHDCGRMAADYLHQRACKRVFFIGRQGGRGMLRQNGFFEGAAAAGLQTGDSILLDTQSLQSGKNIYQKIAPNLQPGDGIFCANDILALGLWDEIRNSVQEPKPVLVGFGDLGYMTRAEPSMAVVGIDSAQMGAKAAHMILSRLRGTLDSSTDYVPVQIRHPE